MRGSQRAAPLRLPPPHPPPPSPRGRCSSATAVPTAARAGAPRRVPRPTPRAAAAPAPRRRPWPRRAARAANAGAPGLSAGGGRGGCTSRVVGTGRGGGVRGWWGGVGGGAAAWPPRLAPAPPPLAVRHSGGVTALAFVRAFRSKRGGRLAFVAPCTWQGGVTSGRHGGGVPVRDGATTMAFGRTKVVQLYLVLLVLSLTVMCVSARAVGGGVRRWGSASRFLG